MIAGISYRGRCVSSDSKNSNGIRFTMNFVVIWTRWLKLYAMKVIGLVINIDEHCQGIVVHMLEFSLSKMVTLFLRFDEKCFLCLQVLKLAKETHAEDLWRETQERCRYCWRIGDLFVIHCLLWLQFLCRLALLMFQSNGNATCHSVPVLVAGMYQAYRLKYRPTLINILDGIQINITWMTLYSQATLLLLISLIMAQESWE